MPDIKLLMYISAPVEICFDLSRSIDLHTKSVQHTREKAIKGVTSGLIGVNETVTWKAKHFGIWWKLTSKITELRRPDFFVDEMVKGTFKSFRHEHHFQKQGNETIMTDYFSFQSPLGLLGKAVNHLFLTQYMRRFLKKRNQFIKEVAESSAWKEIL